MTRARIRRPGERWRRNRFAKRSGSSSWLVSPSRPFAFGVAFLVLGAVFLVLGVIPLVLANGVGQAVFDTVLGVAASAIGVRYLLEARARRRLRVSQEQERASLERLANEGPLGAWWLGRRSDHPEGP